MGPVLVIFCVAGAVSFLTCDYLLSAVPDSASDEAMGRGAGIAVMVAVVVFFVTALALSFAAVRAEEFVNHINHIYTSLMFSSASAFETNH